jgi:hypothetical protein
MDNDHALILTILAVIGLTAAAFVTGYIVGWRKGTMFAVRQMRREAETVKITKQNER